MCNKNSILTLLNTCVGVVLFRASLGKRLETDCVEPLTTPHHSSSLGNKELEFTVRKVGMVTAACVI